MQLGGTLCSHQRSCNRGVHFLFRFVQRLCCLSNLSFPPTHFLPLSRFCFQRAAAEQDGSDTAQLTYQSGQDLQQPASESQLPAPQAVKMGWIKGVLMRCIINIW